VNDKQKFLEDLKTGVRYVVINDCYKIVKELGMAANGAHSNLKIVEIPGDIEWLVQEYDGAEWVAEAHRTWS